MTEPLSITAGDTVSWTRTEAQYPASAGWVLTYYLSCGPAAPIALTSTASGDDHAISAAAAITAEWPAGEYHWTVRVSKTGGEVHSLGSGVLTIAPDPSTAADRRTNAEKCLASIDAALEKSVGSATVECELDGVKVKKDRTELIRIRDYYRSEVRRQRGGAVLRQIQVRFGSA